jgi:hypothetical protein
MVRCFRRPLTIRIMWEVTQAANPELMIAALVELLRLDRLTRGLGHSGVRSETLQAPF